MKVLGRKKLNKKLKLGMKILEKKTQKYPNMHKPKGVFDRAKVCR